MVFRPCGPKFSSSIRRATTTVVRARLDPGHGGGAGVLDYAGAKRELRIPIPAAPCHLGGLDTPFETRDGASSHRATPFASGPRTSGCAPSAASSSSDAWPPRSFGLRSLQDHGANLPALDRRTPRNPPTFESEPTFKRGRVSSLRVAQAGNLPVAPRTFPGTSSAPRDAAPEVLKLDGVLELRVDCVKLIQNPVDHLHVSGQAF